jgi:hypothetical protein
LSCLSSRDRPAAIPRVTGGRPERVKEYYNSVKSTRPDLIRGQSKSCGRSDEGPELPCLGGAFIVKAAGMIESSE